jgi:hypothetical protein
MVMGDELGFRYRQLCTDSIGGSLDEFAPKAITNSLRCRSHVRIRTCQADEEVAMTEVLRHAPNRDEAEETAIAALVFLSEDESRLTRFLSESGLDPADLRKSAGESHILAALLDHLLSDESLLLVFAAGAGLDPARLAPMRAVLDGESCRQKSPSAAKTPHGTAARKGSKRWPGP